MYRSVPAEYQTGYYYHERQRNNALGQNTKPRNNHSGLPRIRRSSTRCPQGLCQRAPGIIQSKNYPEPARMTSVKTEEMEKKETRRGSLKTATFVVNNF